MNRKRDLLASGLCLLFAVVLTIGIPTIQQRTEGFIGPKFMPILVVIALVLCALWIGIPALRAEKSTDKEKEASPKTAEKISLMDFVFERHAVFFMWVVLVAYALLMKPLGFIVSSALMVFLLCLLLAPKAERHYAKFAALAVISSVLIYFVFVKLFLLLLPKGILAPLL